MHGLIIWAVVLVPLALLAWSAWPRRVPSASGRDADASHLTERGDPAGPLRVATFNLHGCRGRDGRRDPSRAARDLAGIDPGIAALQEVHDTWRAPRQHADLAERLGLAVLHAPTRARWLRPHRGNALLSRYPIAQWTRLPLPGDPAQRFHFRNLTVARLDAQPPVHVLVTHLNRKGERKDQLDMVMYELLRYSPAVLLGDFNMTREHPGLKAYLERGDVVDALGETLDEDSPERIDWILCRGMTPLRAGVVDSGASDHPLYWCELEPHEL